MQAPPLGTSRETLPVLFRRERAVDLCLGRRLRCCRARHIPEEILRRNRVVVEAPIPSESRISPLVDDQVGLQERQIEVIERLEVRVCGIYRLLDRDGRQGPVFAAARNECQQQDGGEGASRAWGRGHSLLSVASVASRPRDRLSDMRRLIGREGRGAADPPV